MKSTVTTYTAIIMQTSQNRLKSSLKDFHLRFKYVNNIATYVTGLVDHASLFKTSLSTEHLSAYLRRSLRKSPELEECRGVNLGHLECSKHSHSVQVNRNRHKNMFFSCHLKILSQVMSNLYSPNALCDNPALKMQ